MDSVTRALMNELAQANGTFDIADDKKFGHFAAYSVISSRYSEEFDTNDLVCGGGQDLGIDAFAVKVNGRLADDAEFVKDVLELNGYLDVEFIVIQAKMASNFDGAAIIALGDNLAKEVFAEKQTLECSEDVQRLISIKEGVLKYASKLKENPVIRVYYVCTGNWNDDAYLQGIFNRKKKELEDTNLFSEVHFEPVGARSLQKLFRETKTSISREVKFDKLVTLPSIGGVNASYLGILPVSEFLKLITDDDKEIVKSVFVDNVRDFQGENPVNKDIAKTIEDGLFDQFVLRNNGITIVARDIRVTASNYTLEDYQIVNGCQTSHVIYANMEKITGDMFVPIKLIHTLSEDVTQSVIKSTNNQTEVDENDLLAITQFQRDLEDYYGSMPDESRLYYERRAKQYAGRSDLEKGRITTIGGQLKSYASMFLELPNQAGRYQGTLLKTVKNQVFAKGHKPEPYYTSAFALYRFDVAVRRLSPSERDIRPFKFYLLLAFRHRYESEPFPGAGNKKAASYCARLNSQLASQMSSRATFDECVSVVREALSNLGLAVDRDNAKTRTLIDEVRRIARTRNSSLS